MMIGVAVLLTLSLQKRGPVDLPLSWYGYPEVVAVARKVGFSDLRTLRLAPGDAEVRIWSGFSLYGFEGLILRRRNGGWRGYGVSYRPDPKSGRFRERPVSLAAPKSGWGGLWRELERRGVLTIPDEASLPDDGIAVDDGVKYLFEVRTGDRYRAYYYDNPEDHPKRPTARAVAGMVRLVRREVPGSRL